MCGAMTGHNKIIYQNLHFLTCVRLALYEGLLNHAMGCLAELWFTKIVFIE